MLTEQVVSLDLDPPVARVVMRRAAKRNALTAAMLQELADALGRAHQHPDVRVVVLTHDGPAFCAGWDIDERASRGADSGGLADVLEVLMRSRLPHVAEVRGAAVGAGVALVAACDLVVAVPSATFTLPEVGVGVVPALVLVPLLRRSVPGMVRQLALTGQPCTAADARLIGLVDVVAEQPALDDAVRGLVHGLLDGAPAALAATKQLLDVGDDLHRDLASAARRSSDAFTTPEAAEGMAAFLERRPARWVPPRRR